MNLLASMLAVAFAGTALPSLPPMPNPYIVLADDYSFNGQSFTDQNNNQDNLCIVDDVVVPCQ